MSDEDANEPLVHTEKQLQSYERSARKQGINIAATYLRERAGRLFSGGGNDERARIMRVLANEISELSP